MKKLIVANWKLNPNSLKKAEKLASAEDHKGVVIAPPFPYLEKIGSVLRNASLAAQDVFWEEDGPYTGEISPTQLRDLGVKYVIIGHSERREIQRETDEMINKKVMATLRVGLQVILLVGEHIEVRKRGIEATKKFIVSQLKNDLRGVPRGHAKNLILTYEPVWAISTGVNAEADIPEEAAEICAYIKNLAKVTRVLYGGSVNAKNAEAFLSHKDIDGALVGSASLKPREFKGIIECA